MLTIQDIGRQVMTGNPLKFYAMLGTEYGIKDRYIQMLKDRYGGDFVEYSTVSSALSLMRQKHIIPITPKLYIIRYDDTFLPDVNDKTQSMIDSLNIIGTIVCIYEDAKHCKKLLKYLPDYAVSIDAVSPQFIVKYLTDEFQNIDNEIASICVRSTKCYSQARNMCRCISYCPEAIRGMTESDIARLFGTVQLSSDSQIRLAVAMRNTGAVLAVIDSYMGTYDNIMYTMLATMLELEKLYFNRRSESDIRKFVNKWTLKDIYNFFNSVYSRLNNLRSSSAVDGRLSVTYLASLLAFKDIPDGGDL